MFISLWLRHSVIFNLRCALADSLWQRRAVAASERESLSWKEQSLCVCLCVCLWEREREREREMPEAAPLPLSLLFYFIFSPCLTSVTAGRSEGEHIEDIYYCRDVSFLHSSSHWLNCSLCFTHSREKLPHAKRLMLTLWSVIVLCKQLLLTADNIL